MVKLAAFNFLQELNSILLASICKVHDSFDSWKLN